MKKIVIEIQDADAIEGTKISLIKICSKICNDVINFVQDNSKGQHYCSDQDIVESYIKTYDTEFIISDRIKNSLISNNIYINKVVPDILVDKMLGIELNFSYPMNKEQIKIYLMENFGEFPLIVIWAAFTKYKQTIVELEDMKTNQIRLNFLKIATEYNDYYKMLLRFLKAANVSFLEAPQQHKQLDK